MLLNVFIISCLLPVKQTCPKTKDSKNQDFTSTLEGDWKTAQSSHQAKVEFA